MAGYFKKRKGPQGPNKNEEKVLRAQKAESQARLTQALGARFPSLKRLKIQLTLLDHRQNVLEEKTLNLGPLDRPVFTQDCPGRCGHGVFDFGAKMAALAAAATPLYEGAVKCQEPLYAGASETCGCELRCRAELEFAPAEAPAPR